MSLTTPVAFFIFNRPDTTERVFDAIRAARPAKLLVVADGARVERPEEAEKCAATRAIVENVDWPCEVLTNFSDVNLGCKRRISSGLDWVFDTVEEAIILEDDCLPHPSFFPYCQELLERYRHDTRIGMISGDNYQFGRRRTDDSYYFSRIAHIWGWATWRRAWKQYDVSVSTWPEIRDGGWLEDVFCGQRDYIDYWSRVFEAVYRGEIDTWDYQLNFCSLANNWLTVLPNVNLISNLGFGAAASRTTTVDRFANMKTQALEFPLRHPKFMVHNRKADEWTHNDHYLTNLLRNKFAIKYRKMFNKYEY